LQEEVPCHEAWCPVQLLGTEPGLHVPSRATGRPGCRGRAGNCRHSRPQRFSHQRTVSGLWVNPSHRCRRCSPSLAQFLRSGRAVCATANRKSFVKITTVSEGRGEGSSLRCIVALEEHRQSGLSGQRWQGSLSLYPQVLRESRGTSALPATLPYGSRQALWHANCSGRGRASCCQRWSRMSR
jgi:hypothetical protein